ncbi:hypothetical protein [Streptomyces sp. NPDC048603]|uniref:hypothetical protein n=1 Tax=Streptomyces sp. NPDC048603 TaxID=3365577 RepID=UPI0037182B31
MNPPAQYGPWQPAPLRAVQPTRREHPAIAVLAGLLWTITLGSLAWLTIVVGIVAIWSAAAGGPVGEFLTPIVLIAVAAVGTFTGLAFIPAIRRLPATTRLLVLGILACPFATGLAIWTWLQMN